MDNKLYRTLLEYNTSYIRAEIPVEFLPTLVDLALQTRDREWFEKLSKAYIKKDHVILY